jgi:hypothetical protein
MLILREKRGNSRIWWIGWFQEQRKRWKYRSSSVSACSWMWRVRVGASDCVVAAGRRFSGWWLGGWLSWAAEEDERWTLPGLYWNKIGRCFISSGAEWKERWQVGVGYGLRLKMMVACGCRQVRWGGKWLAS